MKVYRYKKEDEYTYALGATVVMEYLLNNPSLVQGVIFHPDFTSIETIKHIEEICTAKGLELDTQAKPFNIVSSKENCFCMAIIRKVNETILDGNHVVLVNPSNAGNLGTIIRSCIGFGVEDIAIILPAVDLFDPKTIRASMGAKAKIRIELFENFQEYEKRFHKNNMYPFMLDGSKKLHETKIEKPFSLILGNEATGLAKEFAVVGQPVRIDQSDKIDSLNLPIATSIGLFYSTTMN